MSLRDLSSNLVWHPNQATKLMTNFIHLAFFFDFGSYKTPHADSRFCGTMAQKKSLDGSFLLKCAHQQLSWLQATRTESWSVPGFIWPCSCKQRVFRKRRLSHNECWESDSNTNSGSRQCRHGNSPSPISSDSPVSVLCETTNRHGNAYSQC